MGSDSEGDASDPEDLYDDDDDDDDDDEDNDIEMAEAKGQSTVHPNRFRIWGLAASPGDGSTAAIVSRYDTQHPARRDFAKVMFGWSVPDDADKRVHPMPPRSTTEARVWEWLYGNGVEVPGTTHAPEIMPLATHSPLREQFKSAIGAMKCVFCDTPMQHKGSDVECENGHSFGKLFFFFFFFSILGVYC